jgi:hypothetical protein
MMLEKLDHCPICRAKLRQADYDAQTHDCADGTDPSAPGFKVRWERGDTDSLGLVFEPLPGWRWAKEFRL